MWTPPPSCLLMNFWMELYTSISGNSCVTPDRVRGNQKETGNEIMPSLCRVVEFGGLNGGCTLHARHKPYIECVLHAVILCSFPVLPFPFLHKQIFSSNLSGMVSSSFPPYLPLQASSLGLCLEIANQETEIDS